MPSARKLSAKPDTIWSARSVTAKNAWMSASAPPAAMPSSSPGSQPPRTSAPKIPKNAPISIMPSRPMLTTPARSLITPPSAPNTSGVAKRSIAAASADQTTTRSRFPSPDCVAATAPIPPITPAATAPQPRRAWPSRTVHTPSPTAISASTTDGAGERTSSGGSATHQATTPSATPPQPVQVERSTPETSKRPRVAVAAVTGPPPGRVRRPAASASAAAGRRS